jgi:ribonuclease HI
MIGEDVEKQTRKMGVAIGHFDGGSSGNPGPGASAWSLQYEHGPAQGTNRLGNTTNNKAEYDGLIRLLHLALAKRGEKYPSLRGLRTDRQASPRRVQGEGCRPETAIRGSEASTQAIRVI